MITILFLAANPTDTTKLRLEQEYREIRSILRQAKFRDQFKLEHLSAVRAEELQGILLEYQPAIVHFSGHGSEFSELFLEDENGQSHPVSGVALQELFSILKDNIRLIVLNACYSERQARAISEEIDCVIGMAKAINDDAAIHFTTALYTALGSGRDIQTAFSLGCNQINLANKDGQDTPQLISNHDPSKIKFANPETLLKSPRLVKYLTFSPISVVLVTLSIIIIRLWSPGSGPGNSTTNDIPPVIPTITATATIIPLPTNDGSLNVERLIINRNSEKCLHADQDESVVMMRLVGCENNGGTIDRWKYDESTQFIINVADGKCLYNDASYMLTPDDRYSHNGKLVVIRCDQGEIEAKQWVYYNGPQ